MHLLIVATILSFVSVHSSLIGKQILKWINKPTVQEKELITQRKCLKQEQSALNMTDNFAKYSKIQRRINAIDEELSIFRSNKNSISLQLGLTYGIRIVFGVLLVIMSIYYRSSPVFTVDSNIDLMPFSYIISYPNGNNVVSFHFWVLCCTAVARLIKS